VKLASELKRQSLTAYPVVSSCAAASDERETVDFFLFFPDAPVVRWSLNIFAKEGRGRSSSSSSMPTKFMMNMMNM